MEGGSNSGGAPVQVLLFRQPRSSAACFVLLSMFPAIGIEGNDVRRNLNKAGLLLNGTTLSM
jgi:hypothetical protein